MSILDVFNSDAFQLVPLTMAINNLKFSPGYISGSGLFAEQGITTTSISIEEKDNVLIIVSPTPRGGTGYTMPKLRRTLRMQIVPHFEINDAIYAEEVQGVRAFGTEDQLQTVMGQVAERLQYSGQSLEYTQEHARMGAVKGIIQYANGQKLDLFSEYNLPVPPNIDMNLDSTATDGSLRERIAKQIIRPMTNNLNVSFSGIQALTGDDFFDALMKNAEFRQTFLNWSAAADLRSAYITPGGDTWGSVPFGGVTWTNYRGNNLDGTPFVETNMAYLYPTGVPDMFKTFFAPADYIETVNTVGRPRYAKQYPMQNNKGIHMDVQMNALNLCTRPKGLMRAVMT